MVIKANVQNVKITRPEEQSRKSEETIYIGRKKTAEKKKYDILEEILEENPEQTGYPASDNFIESGKSNIQKYNREYYRPNKISQDESCSISAANEKTKLIKTKGSNLKIGSKLNKADERIEDAEEMAAIQDSPEYEGRKQIKKEKKFVKKVAAVATGIFANMLLLAKLIVSVLTNMIAVIAIVTVCIVVVVVSTLRTATYNFVVDEEMHIREMISNISAEVDGMVQEEKGSLKNVQVTGELADWKEVIAFWWALDEHYSDDRHWDNYAEGDDYGNLKYVFYQFNSFSFLQDTEADVLKVNIVNASLEEMSEHWALDSEQRAYLAEMIADDEIWDDILGTTELSRIAYGELSNSADKYQEFSQENKYLAFVQYCFNAAGLYNADFMEKQNSVSELRSYFFNLGFNIDSKSGREGDVIFLLANGELRVGIISRTEDDVYYVITQGAGETISEQAVNKTSSMVDSVVRIWEYIFNLKSTTGGTAILSGNGELLWPVGAECYYVTSCFGPRWGTIHQGTDIKCVIGTPIVAAESGTVVASYLSSTAGEYIIIEHGGGLKTEYMHNSVRLVSVGEQVTRGQIIAYSGNTGQSTGPHCHFGVRLNGTRVDPAPWLGIPANYEGDVSSYIKGE
ncbi:MAG: M23 family metallopeptidase [Lachnospiraceae bacterium]|nr:M23 family metallopeptidase [Lachnospiraceae bacterium]